MKRQKIGIVGAGALGCTIASLLAIAGYDVELAKIYKSQLALPSQPAIEVNGEFGDHTAIVNTCKGIEKFSSLKDFIFIVPKAKDVKKCTSIALKYLSHSGKIVTLQNVLTIDDVLAVAPREKVLGLILGWTTSRTSLFEYTVLSKGINIIGSFCPNMERSILELKDILSNITDTYAYKNFIGIAISRLIINSCISSLGCITGARLGNLMTLKNVKKLFEGLFREDMAVAKARGIKIVPYCREFDYYKLMESGLVARINRRRKLDQLGTQNPYIVSSMLRNIENNKDTEIEYINGYFAKHGKLLNIDTPLNNRLMEMISDIENHEIGIFPDNACDYYLRKPHKYREREDLYVNRRNQTSKY